MKIRIANQPDPDFIEMDLPRKKLTYTGVIAAMCDELDVQVKKGKNCYSAMKTSDYTQCENSRILLTLRFYVKLVLVRFFQDLGCVVNSVLSECQHFQDYTVWKLQKFALTHF